MPEYSSTTITPSGSIKVPAMNGATSGNFDLDALKNFVNTGMMPEYTTDDSVWDTTPTASSTNAVTSGGIHTAIGDEASARQLYQTVTDKRLDNLEQAAGSYVPVVYRGNPSDTYGLDQVPTGKADYALVESLQGKKRGWNNILSIGNFGDSTGWATTNATINSVSDNVLTFTASANKGKIETNGNYRPYFTQGHAYLFVAEIKLTTATTEVYMNNGFNNANAIATTSWQTLVSVVSNWTSTSGLWQYPAIVDGRTGSWDAIQVRKALVRDLTLIFPDNTPTTVADALQRCPDLAKWDAYGYSLVTETVSAVKSVGVNIFDEVMELGSIDNGGQNTPSTTLLRSTNYQPVKGDTKYFFNTRKVAAHEYDINKNWIGETSGGQNDGEGYNWTTRPNCAYLRFRTTANYGTTYLHDIQICLNSYADKAIYHAHEEHTLTLPSNFTGKSAGTVAEVYDLATGKVTHPVKEIDLGDLTWTYYPSLSNARFKAILNPAVIIPPNNGTLFLGTSGSEYVIVDYYTVYSGSGDKCIAVGADGYINLRDTSKSDSDLTDGHASWLEGKKLTYALATPDPDTDLAIVQNNFIKTQGGGTIRTVQTQEPELDSMLTVGYLTV